MGRKISNFPANTALPADTELTFISGNTNFKIGLTDFLAALNVTGTIVQEGDAGDTPVLNKDGTVNEIRNLEAGTGITLSIEPSGSIKISSP